MPNTKSAKKALRQNIQRRARNLSRKKETKKTIKTYKKLMKEGKKEEAKNYIPTLYKALDKMAKVGIIKKGKSIRLKSRLSKMASKEKLGPTKKQKDAENKKG